MKHFTCTLFVISLLLSPLTFSAEHAEKSVSVLTTISHSDAYIKSTKEKLHEVFQQPEFGKKQKETRLRLKEPFKFSDSDKSDHNELGKLVKWIKNLGLWIARFTEILLWIGIVIISFLIFYFRHRWLKYLNWLPHAKLSTIEEENTLSIVKSIETEHLPSNISDAVLKYWNQGHKTTALSLLYRATLRDLRQVYQLKLPKAATEQEIVDHVHLKHAPLHPYVSQLTHDWQYAVYAHQHSSASIHTLLEDYQRFFVKAS